MLKALFRELETIGRLAARARNAHEPGEARLCRSHAILELRSGFTATLPAKTMPAFNGFEQHKSSKKQAEHLSVVSLDECFTQAGSPKIMYLTDLDERRLNS